MIRSFIRFAALALLVVAMLRDVTWRKRKQARFIRDQVDAPQRFVDIGVRLCTVVADPDGAELVPGCPRLRVVREQHFGGIVDTFARPAVLVGPSADPQTWFCSEDQEVVLLHPDDAELGQLVYGSEGAGKTRVLAMWHYFRWLELLGEEREGGQTAPTKPRLKMVRDELQALFPDDWYTYRTADDLFLLSDGSRIQLRATKKQSASGGSPVQGFNWSWCGRDEGQDQIERHEDIESRGRKAKHGRYKQLITATAKDSAGWRDFRDALLKSGLWVKRTLLGIRSPFISPKFWADKKLVMSPREYQRRVLAQDVGAELAVYYAWDRERNLRSRPRGARDVTREVLLASGYESYLRPGSPLTLLVGHDPGVIYNTSVVLQCLLVRAPAFPGGWLPVWFIVGELQTKQTTQREHAIKLRAYLAERFEVELAPRHGDLPGELPKAATFVDPHGKGEGATDYQSVYMAFQAIGLDVFSPAPTSGRIKRSARVEMVNRLLFSASDIARLVVELLPGGMPAAPVLVDSFESLEKRPGDDNPEGGRRKDVDDKTHAPAAGSYALWLFEQEAITRTTIDRALATLRFAA